MSESVPYRAEQVGSLPRPQRLAAARERRANDEISAEELARIEDEAIGEAVVMQDRVGIGAITDGEYRKRSWRDFLYDRMDGFSSETAEHRFPIRMFDGTELRVREPKVAQRLSRREPLTANDFASLRQMTTRPVKANMPTPSALHFFTGDAIIADSPYESVDDYLDDISRLMRDEVAELASRGCTYLQLDEVPLAVICDPHNMEVIRQRGEDPDRLIDLYIDAINAAIRDRPSDMAVCVHMCRGNNGHGMADGGYEPIAERAFNRLDVDGFFLEYDTPRAGDFRPLRHVPAPKKVVLGIVSSKHPELEAADDLKRRIDEATEFVDIDRLCLSPQCGFASVPNKLQKTMTMDQVEAKLGLVVAVAGDVWG
jgi:5-methyltetrahydropteroyltriglutamate--homocysteine methyltransferase